jgi:[ribosomal protein S18]-alanine N-acetyltransferase
MPKTCIRSAVSTDFPTLLRIDKASFPPGVAYDFAELSYFMKRDGATTLVAEVDGEIVGFLLMEVMDQRRTATLVTIDIRDEHRRHGHATELLAQSETILREKRIRRYELQVDVGNAGALEFYRKHGFENVRRLAKYYSNGNDAFLMAKQIVS